MIRIFLLLRCFRSRCLSGLFCRNGGFRCGCSGCLGGFFCRFFRGDYRIIRIVNGDLVVIIQIDGCACRNVHFLATLGHNDSGNAAIGVALVDLCGGGIGDVQLVQLRTIGLKPIAGVAGDLYGCRALAHLNLHRLGGIERIAALKLLPADLPLGVDIAVDLFHVERDPGGVAFLLGIVVLAQQVGHHAVAGGSSRCLGGGLARNNADSSRRHLGSGGGLLTAEQIVL